MNYVGRGQSAELMREGGVCPPGLTFANGVADGRKSFPEQMFISLQIPVAGLGVARPTTDTPHTGSKLASAKRLCQCSEGDV